MKYYKTIENGIITMIGSGSSVHESQTEITKEEYDSLMEVINDRPEDAFESVYELKEAGMYEPRERTESEKVDWFTMVVINGTVELDAVPTEYRAEVKARLPKTKAEELLEEVANYDY